jgi:hypothetical protein
MNVRTLTHVLLGLLLLMLARHLWLATYVHPFGDDFSYAVAGMRFPLPERLLREYTSWNGRYFSNVLVLRDPLVLGLGTGLPLYRAAAMGLIVLTFLGAHAMVRAWIGAMVRREVVWIAALGFTLMYLHLMPDANEGFYWYTGAVTYQLPNALSLFLIANWIKHFKSERAGAFTTIVWVQVLLVIMIAGCNEVHMAFMFLGHLGLLWMRYRATGRPDRSVVLVCIIATVCAVVVILAPGNAHRSVHFPMKHEPLRTVAYSIAQTGRFIGKWFFLSHGFLITLLVPAVARWLSDRSPNVRRLLEVDRWSALSPVVAVVLLPFIITYWSSGLLGQYRTVNVSCFYFLITWVLAVAVWDHQVFRKRWTKVLPPDTARGVGFTIATFALLMVLGRDLAVDIDLLGGHAARYDASVEMRYDMVREAIEQGASEVVLPPLSDEPRSLNILPLNPSPDHWMNRSMADYFGKADLDIIPGDPQGSPQ